MTLKDVIKPTALNAIRLHGDKANLLNRFKSHILQGMIKATLEYTNNNLCATSRIIGLDRATIRKLINKHKEYIYERN